MKRRSGVWSMPTSSEFSPGTPEAVVEANDVFLSMVGYDREDLAAGLMHRTDVTPPEWSSLEAQTDAELKAAGAAQPYETEYVRKDGSRVPVLIGAAAFDERGNEGVRFVLDLSGTKRAEAEARESERRWLRGSWPSAWLQCSRGAYLCGPDGQTRNKGSLR